MFAGIMIVSGLLTLTMLYAAIAPGAALQTYFGETVESQAVSIVVSTYIVFGKPD